MAWAGAALIPLLHLVAMQFIDEVNWGVGDFVVAGVLMFGTGLAYELAVRMSSDTAYRAAAGIALAAAFILIWVNLAVGIIGSEDELANLMYFGVLAVGIIGALIARFQPHGTRAVCDGAHAGVSRRDRAARRMGLHGALYNPWSLHNAESQVDSLRRFDHFDRFK